VINQN